MKRFISVLVAIALLFTAGAAFAGGGQEGSGGAMSGSAGANQILGAGASFPAPYYTKAFDEYNKATGIQVNYQSIGSSGGRKNIADRVVDFGGSDSYVPDSDFGNYPATIVHIPTVIGAIVVTYNLPDDPTIRLTGPVVADIFLGTITKWNDPAITALNPGVSLPNLDILVAHRSDGSGTTDNFTKYLSAVSESWKSEVGSGSSVNWPVGQGGAQNPGVAAIVKSTPGTIGYVEIAYALQNGLPYATLQNKSGNWIVPSLESTSLSAAAGIPADTRIVLGNTSAPQGYPITAMTWLIVYKEQKYGDRTMAEARALVDLLWWITHDGQQYAETLDYAPLPDAAVKAAEAIIKSITYDGTPVMN